MHGITVHRLFGAAEAILAAVRSPAGPNALIEVAPNAPRSMRADAPYSRAELVEAWDFLVRCGFVERVKARPPAPF